MGYVLLIALALLSSLPARAQSAIYGPGSLACPEILQMAGSTQYKPWLVLWFGGYVSGVNAALVTSRKMVLDVSGLNPDLIVGSVVSYCTKNPAHRMAEASDWLAFQQPMRPWSPKN